MSPARLSPELSRLFPAGAQAAELREPGDPTLLLPGEARHLGGAVEKRVREFAAGRTCARRALAEFGIADVALDVGAAREPVWPPSMAGSITHTAGFCAAVVAPRSIACSIGIDTEVVGHIKPEIWPRIYLSGEIGWLSSLGEAQSEAAAALLFCAKEAFYKCQYPLTREWLDFSAVKVSAPHWGAPLGEFEVSAGPGITATLRERLPMQGRYLLHQEFVTAGIAWLP